MMDKEEQLLTAFSDLYNKRVWLDKLMMEPTLKGYTSSEVHCIEAIGKLAEPNATQLAETLFLTRGAVSKLVRKLTQKGTITGYKKPENKKEVYFRLTPKGQAVFEIHEALHQQLRERDQEVFQEVSDEQLTAMLSFMHRYSQHLDQLIQEQTTK